MLKEFKEENKEYFESVQKYLEMKGHTEIHVDLEGYDRPTSYSLKGQDLVLTPDLVSLDQMGVSCVSEIAFKGNDQDLLKTKWNFLFRLSVMKDTSFIVFAHKGNYQLAIEILKTISPEIRLIRL